MTEQEAIRYGEEYLHDLCCAACKVEDRHKEFVRVSIKALEEIQQYREIGTPEECRAAVEKQRPKKPLYATVAKDGNRIVGVVGRCPCCGEIIDDTTLVCDCGQKMDW